MVMIMIGTIMATVMVVLMIIMELTVDSNYLSVFSSQSQSIVFIIRQFQHYRW